MIYLLPYLVQQEPIREDNEEENDEAQIESVEEEDLDKCGLISNQHCREDGLCEYCAMCLRDSCITDANTCSEATTNKTNLYDWFDDCLIDESSSSKNLCATNVECFQYYKTSGRPSTYTLHSLTCNPSNCMLIRNKNHLLPEPKPLPPVKSPETHSQPRKIDRHQTKEHGLVIVASCCTTCVLFIAIFFWFCRKKRWLPFQKTKQECCESISSIPNSAPPSFRTIPSCAGDRASCRSSQTLPVYVSACHPPPKYEQAIVTQIRDQPENVVIHHYAHYDPVMCPSWSPSSSGLSSSQNRTENSFSDIPANIQTSS
ncbi:hypothetical protein A0J61_08371 [Choanephora cucurbitarum]|uniref:Uncharacterized protein n=1 Tax=Choanephora cucurbitarum TaxID=101091 RepID=A0A1C7N3C7_9FUNG|nr:hypothetical protein A0J61_08371 [Choanephora cucurbitarum]